MAGISSIKMPRQIKNPEDNDSPMMVKYYGAKAVWVFLLSRIFGFPETDKPG